VAESLSNSSTSSCHDTCVMMAQTE
jgi:hypothetical protein